LKSALLNIEDLLKELFTSDEIKLLNIILEKKEKKEVVLSKILGVK